MNYLYSLPGSMGSVTFGNWSMWLLSLNNQFQPRWEAETTFSVFETIWAKLTNNDQHLTAKPGRVDGIGLVRAALQGCTIGSEITDHTDFCLFSALFCRFSALFCTFSALFCRFSALVCFVYSFVCTIFCSGLLWSLMVSGLTPKRIFPFFKF